MGKLALNRDFTKFLDDDSFPHQVEILFGDRRLVCSGMVLAQQSSIIEENIRQNNILMFEKMDNIGTVDEKVNCIKYMYGATLELNLKEIETTTIFASLYGVSDLFNKCLKWIENNLSARNLINFYKMSDRFEAKDNKSRMKTLINNFITKNKDSIGEELIVIISNGGSVIDSDLMISIIKLCPKNGAKLITEWCSQDSENQTLVLEQADKIDFAKLFPLQPDFTEFIGSFSQNSDSVEVMKQVLAIQQSYFVKITQKSAPEPAQEPVKANEDGSDDDDDESVASSTNTGGKPKANRGGRKQNKNTKGPGKFVPNNQSGGKPSVKQAQQNPPRQHQNVPSQQQNKQYPQQKQQSNPPRQQESKAGNPPQKGKPHQQKQDPQKFNQSPEDRKIFVANLPDGVTQDDVKAPFLFCGVVMKVDLILHKKIAFVEFADASSVQMVLNASKNGVKFTINGHLIGVNKCMARASSVV